MSLPPDLLAQIVEARRASADKLAASPHRCPCGANVYEAGERCPPCDEKHQADSRYREERDGPVNRTVQHLPDHYKHAWIRLGRPEMLVASDGRKRVKDPKAMEQVQDAIASGTRRLTFLGPTGAGKTLLATASMIALVERIRPLSGGRFISATALQAAPNDYGNTPLVDEMIQAPVLIIDDLGQEPITRDGRSHVTRVIFERFDHARHTIVTTGLMSPELVMDRYANPGLRRRLFEPCETAVINVSFVPDTGAKPAPKASQVIPFPLSQPANGANA